MIKGIIFDLDGVYFKNGTSNFIKNISSIYKVDSEEVRRVYLKSEEMSQYKKGLMTGDDFWSFAIRTWGINATPAQLIDILIQGYERNEPAQRIIEAVKEKEIKTIICSNNFKERIEGLDRRFTFLNDFDIAVLSYKYGVLKPDLLEKVPIEAGIGAEEILVIDDGEMVIEGAQKRGFKTILCENPWMLEKYLNDAGIVI